MKNSDVTFNNPQDIVKIFGVVQSNFQSILLNFISVAQIINSEKKVNNKLMSGTDKISSFLVKDLITILASPLKYIFNLIIKTNVFLWKLYQFLKKVTQIL